MQSDYNVKPTSNSPKPQINTMLDLVSTPRIAVLFPLVGEAEAAAADDADDVEAKVAVAVAGTVKENEDGPLGKVAFSKGPEISNGSEVARSTKSPSLGDGTVPNGPVSFEVETKSFTTHELAVKAGFVRSTESEMVLLPT
jgi:hypothetical protein